MEIQLSSFLVILCKKKIIIQNLKEFSSRKKAIVKHKRGRVRKIFHSNALPPQPHRLVKIAFNPVSRSFFKVMQGRYGYLEKEKKQKTD